MLKIGEFAALSTISISMLRNYDKQGILVPTHVDQESGYRYYDKKQLVDANRIVGMKSMGFGLEEIKDLLQSEPDNIDHAVQKKLQQKKEELRQLVEQIHRLEEADKLKQTEEDYALSIATKVMPAMNVVSYRNHISAFNQEGILWNELTSQCQKHGIRMTEQSLSMAIQHEFSQELRDVDVEVMLVTDRIYKDVSPLNCYTIPEREVASIVFQGSYMQIGKINSFIAKWLENNDYEIVGNPFSIYHMSPRDSKEEMQFITELAFPIQLSTSEYK